MRASDTILSRLLELHPKRIDLSLGRILRLAETLGNPQNELPPIIHVAGTNGKGSFIAFMSAILQQAGYSVGAYISPHLCDFAERILFDGTPIAEPDLSRHLATCERHNNGAPITFFEITTLAAFLSFAERQPDILLLEVGLGGEFDATNIIFSPILSVITPIGLDHVEFLGDTIEQIASAKAGIIKPGVTVVAMPENATAAAVIEKTAARHGSPCRLYGRDFDLSESLPRLSLIGEHQKRNASLVQAAVAELRLQNFTIPREAVNLGLSNAEWAGRLQNLYDTELQILLPDWEIYLDGGHNVSAATILARQAEIWNEPLTVIMGMQSNKDAGGFLRILKPHITELLTVPLGVSSNGFSAAELGALAKAASLRTTACRDFATAIDHVRGFNRGGRLLICGSLYLAGEVIDNYSCKKA